MSLDRSDISVLRVEKVSEDKSSTSVLTLLFNIETVHEGMKIKSLSIFYDIETEKSGKTFMTNELQLMYEDQATETVEISVVEISAS